MHASPRGALWRTRPRGVAGLREAEGELGGVKDVFGHENEGDEKSPNAPVAVKEWVNGLELRMGQARLDERRRTASLVEEELLEVGEQIAKQVRGRRNEVGISRSGPADPVL